MTDIATIITENPAAVLIDPKTYSEFFKHIKAETDAFVPDLSTASSRKEIASLAYKVTRTKTAIDAAGKKLNEEARAKINAVDAQRRKIRDELDELAETVRRPLTQWEQAEEGRVNHIKALLQHIEDCGDGMIGGEPQAFGVLFRELEEKITLDASTFGEFLDQATTAKRFALEKLNAAFEAHKKAEADREELERLRAAEAERQKIEAERAAAEEAEKRKVEQERLEAERAARAEEEKRLAAEQARKDAEAEAARKLEAAEAEKRAVIEAHERAERERLAEEQRIADEQAAREANKAHRGRVMKSAKEAIMAQGPDEDAAKKIVLAIIAGEIPNVTLRF